MPSRNQAIIRRDINRLNELVEREKDSKPALMAISQNVSDAANEVNTAWQHYQAITIQGDKEREERDDAVRNVIKWIQRWRLVILVNVPGAEKNIRNLPSSGATPDDVIRVADDMVNFINKNKGAESFLSSAIEDLGEGIENARKETAEATAILPAESAAREALTRACLSANTILIPGTEIVRSIFGRTSPQYKQFIARSSASEEEEIDKESNLGEE